MRVYSKGCPCEIKIFLLKNDTVRKTRRHVPFWKTFNDFVRGTVGQKGCWIGGESVDYVLTDI